MRRAFFVQLSDFEEHDAGGRSGAGGVVLFRNGDFDGVRDGLVKPFRKDDGVGVMEAGAVGMLEIEILWRLVVNGDLQDACVRSGQKEDADARALERKRQRGAGLGRMDHRIVGERLAEVAADGRPIGLAKRPVSVRLSFFWRHKSCVFKV